MPHELHYIDALSPYISIRPEPSHHMRAIDDTLTNKTSTALTVAVASAASAATDATLKRSNLIRTNTPCTEAQKYCKLHDVTTVSHNGHETRVWEYGDTSSTAKPTLMSAGSWSIKRGPYGNVKEFAPAPPLGSVPGELEPDSHYADA